MFPNELKRLKNWVGYIGESKCPMNPYTGKAAESDNKMTWGTYEEAKQATTKYGWAGVGFMFEPPYVGIDLDDCIVDGKLNDFARETIRTCKSYTEYSPSRTGIHIIGKGLLSTSLKKPFIEVYQNQRYFTVTEKPLQPVYPLRDIDLSFTDKYRDGIKAPISLTNRLADIKEGSRNNIFTSIAGSLRRNGYSSEDIFSLLKAKAEQLQFDEKELWSICRSVGRYPAALPVQADGQGESIDSFLANSQKVEWICEPIIAKNSIGFVAGLPEAKKTWLLMDLAIEMARGGGLWLKKFPVVGGKVLFIDQERARSETQRRLNAVIAGKDLTVKDLKGSLFVRCGSSTKLDLQHSYDAFRKELGDIKPDIVMVDSFATFHTKEESNRMEIQQVLERIKKLRDEFGCTFLLVHHETKASYQNRKEGGVPSYLDMSGNVAIPAAAEMTLNVVQHDDEKSMVHHTKSTLSVKIAPFIVKVIDLLPDRSKIAVEAY